MKADRTTSWMPPSELATRPERSSLLAFFSFTYIVSWAFWFAALQITPGHALPRSGVAGFAGPVFLLGVFAPSLVALSLTARAGGRVGLRALLGRIVNWPSGARWYVFAMGYMVAIKLAAAVVHRILTGVWPPFGQEAFYIMAAAMVVSTPVQAGEEIGWRGYALPRLASLLGLPAASIVLGVMWACWHLPIFFMTGSDKAGQSFPVYLLGVTAMSVAMAWLYWRTNESLFLTMLMHAAINNTKDIVPSAAVVSATPFSLNASLVAWLTAALLWIPAVYFLVRMRGGTLRTSVAAVTGAPHHARAVDLGRA